jgi:ferric-dicitrate binding protein FerR (iron transport regulator)
MKPDPEELHIEDQANRVAYLVAGHLRQILSEAEKDELDAWITKSDANQRLFEELVNPQVLEQQLQEYEKPDEAAALKRIKEKLKFSAPVRPIQKTNRNKVLRWSIAASVILLTGTIIYFVNHSTNNRITPVPESQKDIVAGGNKATLQLADGRIIDLAAAKNGLIDSTDGPDVLKTAEGQLSYETSKGSGKGEHILSTPAGGQYAVTLPDGTRVWLNAGSSLKYPVVFGNDERVVELDGEGYFEVEKAPSNSPQGGGQLMIPFVVKLRDGSRVEVLGTHFNINAYDDEAEMRTTLMEGKVRVVSGEPSVVSRELVPGQQAKVLNSVRDDGQVLITVMDNVDMDAAIAWKNGKFQFIDATIETIMRQVARWYDAEIVYDGKVDYHFNATIYRSEHVSKLLELLEETGRVHFKVEGRRVVVMK